MISTLNPTCTHHDSNHNYIQEKPSWIHVLPHVNPRDIMHQVVDQGQEEPFYVVNLDLIISKYQLWTQLLPGVTPYYAVKANNHRVILQLLAALGAGFDCASKGEIELVTSLGVSPDRIIFANPTKPASHIRYAKSTGVTLMTFDNATELQKIKQLHPSAELVLRVRCDAARAQCPLGAKFGADPASCYALMKTASALGLNLVGVSFHVGSGCQEPEAYSRAIRTCGDIMRQAQNLGFDLRLLDIGGGFTDLAQVSEEIWSAFEAEALVGVKMVAEPGRFLVEEALSLATCVHSLRDGPSPSYYINDGVYGSFNILLYDHAVKRPEALRPAPGSPVTPSTVWGPTCDSLDKVAEGVPLPRLSVGDWLVWSAMGAYTISAIGGSFNGFPLPQLKFYVSESNRALLNTDAFLLSDAELITAFSKL